MKLLRYGPKGQEKPGLLDSQGLVRDLSDHFADFTPKELSKNNFIEQLQRLDTQTLPIVSNEVRLGAPIGLPGKIICVGLNSQLHAKEMGMSLLPHDDMLLFIKASSSLCGPNDPILYTRLTKKLDWEAELAIVIGKQGKYISKDQADEYILGYTCMNDLSERFLQFETPDSQFTKAKSFDNAAPLGPYIVTKDEIDAPHQLQVNLWVNQQLRQTFNTVDYIHDHLTVVSYISQYFTLYPGDVISMGSAPGSARYWGDSYFLKPDDEVVLSITKIGTQSQKVIIERE